MRGTALSFKERYIRCDSGEKKICLFMFKEQKKNEKYGKMLLFGI